MYSAIILAALIATQAFAADRVSDGKEFGSSAGIVFQVVDDLTLRQLVETSVANIDHIARLPWTAEHKLTAINLELRKVEAYREKAWSRSPATEHKLDLLIKPYESFPEASQFRRQNCNGYFSTIKIDWEPTAKAEPTLKGVKRAWENLRAICEG